MRFNYPLLIVLLSVFNIAASFGQGCSDAGGCSVHSLNIFEDPEYGSTKVQFSVEQSFGLGEKLTVISQTTASIQYRIFERTSLEIRSPFIFTIGNLGQTSGVGDILLSVNQEFFRNNKKSLNLIVAGRLKTNNANYTYGGEALPMAYQTSLGTYDGIAGLFLSLERWDFYSAFQHSFGRNGNSYLVTDTTTADSKKYFESAQLKRGDDFYFRVRRAMNLRNENGIIFTLLTIYRLQEDEIIKNDVPVGLDGSQGLTINIGFTWSKKLSSGQTMEISLSFPVVEREYRADGLTRNAVVGLRLSNL